MKYYAIHNTSVSRALNPLQFESVEREHKRKWNSLSSLGYYTGYNRYTEPDGTRYETRAIGEETIANIGHNCDIPDRCDTISHCLGGYFKVENPTIHQINDVLDGFYEARKEWPGIKLVQHSDLQPGRTCAELSPTYLQSWLTEEDDCGEELARAKKERDIYKNAFHTLVEYITK